MNIIYGTQRADAGVGERVSHEKRAEALQQVSVRVSAVTSEREREEGGCEMEVAGVGERTMPLSASSQSEGRTRTGYFCRVWSHCGNLGSLGQPTIDAN